MPCPHCRQFAAGGSHEFQAVHPQTVLSPLESLTEKMRLKSSERVVTQEFYLPWESHGSLEQPLQCPSCARHREMPPWAPARLLPQAGVLLKEQTPPNSRDKPCRSQLMVAFGTLRSLPAFPTLQSDSRAAGSAPERSCSWERAAVPTELLHSHNDREII